MCGRYLYSLDNQELREIAEEAQRNLYGEYKTGEIYPTNVAPIIISSGNVIRPVLTKWGLKKWDNKGNIINARSEGIRQKPMFKKLIESKRCIVPASAFFEWKEISDKEKEKYIFYNNDGVLYMAGLYEVYESVPNEQLSLFDSNDKVDNLRYTIITKAASGSMVGIHQRMPVIFNKEEMENWLLGDSKVDELLANNDVDLNKDKNC